MRVLFGVLVVLGVLGCDKPSKSSGPPLPAGAVQFRFPELLTQLCGADGNGCGGASRPFVAGLRSAAFSADGKLVAMGVDFWHLKLDCDINGCKQLWEKLPQDVCYSIEGSTLAPATGCPALMDLGPTTLALSDPHDGYPVDHAWRRAMFGVPNVDAPARTAKGFTLDTRWLGDLDLDLASPVVWDLAFAGSSGRRTFASVVSNTQLQLLLPEPDAVPLAQGLMRNETGLFWATQSDDVYALTLEDSLRLTAQRVRGAITKPQTKTAGVRVVGSDVLSIVLTLSDNTISGLNEGPVYEVSVLRSPKLDEATRPLLPVGPFLAHAPTPWSVVACFTQPIDSVSSSQFSLAGVEISAATVVPGVPQCVRLTTATLLRNATLSLSVDGVTTRAGDVVRGARISVVAPDFAPVPGAQVVELPRGTTAVYPVSDDQLLITNGGDVGLVDRAGLSVTPIANVGQPTSGSFFFAKSDDTVQGLWVSFSQGGNTKLLLETAGGVKDLSGADVVNGGGLMMPAGDGSLLVAGADSKFLRLQFPQRQSLPRVTVTNFRGVAGAGRVLIEDAGKLQLVTLPDTFEAQTFALPTSAMGAVNGPAFETGGAFYWCAAGRLFRLGASSTTDVAGCSELVRDPRGVLWATVFSSQTLTRVEGQTLTPVVVPRPYDATKTLSAPKFKGGSVWFDQDTLRLDDVTWRQLVGETP